MMRRLNLVLFTVLSAAVLAGCASSRSGGVYDRGSARVAYTVQMGVVESVRNVTLEGTNSGVGAAGGAVVGGVAGSHAGRGSGQVVGAVIGSILGGLAGSAIERNTTQKNGLEITVKLDTGKLLAVVQETDELFRTGDRVRVLSNGGETRVSH